MAYGEGMDVTKKGVKTLINRCIQICDLLGDSISMIYDIVGIPSESKSENGPQPTGSLGILSFKLTMIHTRAEVLHEYLGHIKEKIGPSGEE